MPDANVYRVRVATVGWGGAPGLNTFYFNIDPGDELGNIAFAEDCAARVRAYMFGLILIFPGTWIATVNPEVDVINTDNGDLMTSYVVNPGAQVAGAAPVGFGPQAAMVCANLLTSGVVDGRRVRGRVFLGPLQRTGDIDGTPDAATVNLVRNGLLTLLGGTLDHPSLAVWSRRRGASLAHPAGLGGSAHQVMNVTVKDTYAVLTSRRQ